MIDTHREKETGETQRKESSSHGDRQKGEETVKGRKTGRKRKRDIQKNVPERGRDDLSRFVYFSLSEIEGRRGTFTDRERKQVSDQEREREDETERHREIYAQRAQQRETKQSWRGTEKKTERLSGSTQRETKNK